MENGHPRNFEERMDRMEAFLQSMVAAMQEYFRLSAVQHEQTMEEIRGTKEEIRELITLQKEHRIDIMALFRDQQRTAYAAEKSGG